VAADAANFSIRNKLLALMFKGVRVANSFFPSLAADAANFSITEQGTSTDVWSAAEWRILFSQLRRLAADAGNFSIAEYKLLALMFGGHQSGEFFFPN